MTEQTRLDMFDFQRLFEQWIIKQINLPDGQIICRPPVSVDFAFFFICQRCFRFRVARFKIIFHYNLLYTLLSLLPHDFNRAMRSFGNRRRRAADQKAFEFTTE